MEVVDSGSGFAGGSSNLFIIGLPIAIGAARCAKMDLLDAAVWSDAIIPRKGLFQIQCCVRIQGSNGRQIRNHASIRNPTYMPLKNDRRLLWIQLWSNLSGTNCTLHIDDLVDCTFGSGEDSKKKKLHIYRGNCEYSIPRDFEIVVPGRNCAWMWRKGHLVRKRVGRRECSFLILMNRTSRKNDDEIVGHFRQS